LCTTQAWAQPNAPSGLPPRGTALSALRSRVAQVSLSFTHTHSLTHILKLTHTHSISLTLSLTHGAAHPRGAGLNYSRCPSLFLPRNRCTFLWSELPVQESGERFHLQRVRVCVNPHMKDNVVVAAKRCVCGHGHTVEFAVWRSSWTAKTGRPNGTLRTSLPICSVPNRPGGNPGANGWFL